MKDLFRNIYKCQQVYNKSSDYLVKQLMLKLALLEVSGWIENAFDDLYMHTAANSSVNTEIDNHIKKVYDFSYEKLKRTLSFCIGINKFMSIEQICSDSDLIDFKTKLKTIKDLRNEFAHNHHQVTHNYISFDVLRTHIRTIYAGIIFIKSNI